MATTTYRCEQCGTSFYSQRELDEHYRSEHKEGHYEGDYGEVTPGGTTYLEPGQSTTPGGTQFVCAQCGTSFESHERLLEHSHQH